MDRLRDERGLLGKLAIAWVIVAALLVVGVADGASILITRLHLSELATKAAIAGATDFSASHDAQHACGAARLVANTADPDLKLGRSFCTVDTSGGRVTVTLRKQAKTILAGRLGFTKGFTSVKDVATNGPSGV